MLGAVPALLMGGVMRTDAVSVALIGAPLILLVPALAWLLRKDGLDGGFLLVLVVACSGIYAMLYGRVVWGEATVTGNLLLFIGAMLAVFGTMRGAIGAAGGPLHFRTGVIRISGAALFFAGAAVTSEWNSFGTESANSFPLLGMLFAAVAVYLCDVFWATHEFNWQTWPVLFLAALLPIGVVLAGTVFVEPLDTGEVVCVAVVAIVVSVAHWLRRWLRSSSP